MNLQSLRYAVEVEKAGSISKAAENLYMNQPNLSKAIKELEASVGVPLFTRSTKGVSAVTAEGRVFIAYAKNILAQFEDMQAYFHDPKTHAFRICIPRAGYITEAFASFLDDCDRLDAFHIRFLETNARQSIQNVAEGEYSLGIMRYCLRDERHYLTLLTEHRLVSQTLLCAERVLVMSRQNPLASKSALTASDLTPLLEVVNDDFIPPHPIAPGRSENDGQTTRRKQVFVYDRASQFDILAGNPRAFMWAAPMPGDMLARYALVQKTCAAENLGFKDVLIFRKGHVFSDWETRFLAKLEKAKTASRG